MVQADFRNAVQEFEELGRSDLGFGIIWGEGGSFSQSSPTDDDGRNHSGKKQLFVPSTSIKKGNV